MAYFNLFYNIDEYGKENIPKEGAYILCSNHIHWLDPVLYVCENKRMIYAMAKEELFNTKIKSFVMRRLGVFPVKRNSADNTAINTAINHLKDGDFLLLYPEGTRYGQEKGVKIKKGAALIAIKARVPIIPMAMVGSFKPFSKIRFKIGKPIDFSMYYPKDENIEKIDARSLIKITNDLMKEINEMRDELYNGLSDKDKKLIQLEIEKSKQKYFKEKKELEASKLATLSEKNNKEDLKEVSLSDKNNKEE